MSKISVARRYFSPPPSFEEAEADSYFEALSHYRDSNKSFLLFPQHRVHRVHYRTPSPLCDDKGHFRQKEAIGLGGRGLAPPLSLCSKGIRQARRRVMEEGKRQYNIDVSCLAFLSLFLSVFEGACPIALGTIAHCFWQILFSFILGVS